MKILDKKYRICSSKEKDLLTNEDASLFWETENLEHNNSEIRQSNNLFSHSGDSFFSYPSIQKGNVHLFGFPYSAGSNKKKSKVQHFPSTLRQSSLRLPIYMEENMKNTSGIYDYIRNKYFLKNCMLIDHGDLSLENKNLVEIDEHLLSVLHYINPKLSKFLVIGGDHSITYTLLKNLMRIIPKKIIIFQFDAHHDCGSDILKLDREVTHSNFVRFLLQEEMIAGIIQIGIRGLRSLGQKYNHPNLYQIHISDIDKLQSIVSDICINNSIEDIVGYISFDVDVLDPRDFPLVDFPKVEGPKFQDIFDMLYEVFKVSPPIVGVDIVEGKSDGEPDQYDPILHIMLYLLEGLTQN